MQTPNSRLVTAWLLVFLLITFAAGYAQNPPEPFTPGEMLTYDVMWTIFRAGEVTATLRTSWRWEPRRLRSHRHGAVGGLCPSPL